METDNLFYQVFQTDVQALFQLLNLSIEEDYLFESITLKTREKRMDGYFRSKSGDGPNVFLEVQGYHDPQINWRFMREIAMFYELKKEKTPFIAVLLFVESQYNPGPPVFQIVPPSQWIAVNLEDCLKNVAAQASTLTVLKPLVAQNLMPDQVVQWKNEIHSLNHPVAKTKFLIELLEHAILQRFPNLTLKEIQAMLNLTPLDQTVAGKELIQMGVEQGLDKGELIGKVRTLQQVLKQSIDSKETLKLKSENELHDLINQLESQLN